jgi:signal transduction histidine kinase
MAAADRDRIGQVLTNLLSNALKYSSAERPIELMLTIEAAANIARAPTAAGGKYESHEAQGSQRDARIAVRDAGPGIPPEALPQLFEQFYQAPGIEAQHGERRGMGLGLYIARELVERHGGRIGVESVVGEGSTFWFTLPLSLPQP